MLTRTMAAVGAAVGAAVAAGSAAAQPLMSGFEGSSEGWTVETRTTPTGAFTLVRVYTPDLVGAGGDPGGYIQELDPDSNWSFFAAPDAWSGNRLAFLGRRLSYSVRTNVVDYPDGRLVVLIGAGGQKISASVGLPTPGLWTRRSVVLDEGPWHVGSSASGAVATRAQVAAVLGSLTRVLIGMEFGSDQLEELVGLDRVVLGECPADFNGDGFLDFFDYDDFVRCFETGSCPSGLTADFNGDGFADFFDYDDFVAAFEAGC